jgi:predicted nucleotide-binding protein (sugar kinase/HSP70/actin superfamily)
MKKKKIIGLIVLGSLAVAGIAYLAYKKGVDAGVTDIVETVLDEGPVTFTFGKVGSIVKILMEDVTPKS